MSLETRLQALITAIGADVKALSASGVEQHNAALANQTGPFATDTYLTGSNLAIPTGKIKAGSKVRWKFPVLKTSVAGTSAPVVTVRVGTNGAIADTSRATLTFAPQTAVADEGYFEIEGVFRAAGATAVLQLMGTIGHRLATTGISTSNNSIVLATSAAFDITAANLKIGLSLNAGSSSVWTVALCNSELFNLSP